MKKVFIIIGMILLLSTIASCNDKDLRDFKGQIVLCNPDFHDENSNNGILIYTPSKDSFLYVSKDRGYRDVSFSESKEKVLGIIGNSLIIEYIINTGEVDYIYEDNNTTPFSLVKYVSKTNYISFVEGTDLFLYNRDTKEKQFIIKLNGDYSWTKDGKGLYYSVGNKILLMDMESKKVSELYNGYGPQLSPSNKFLAFKNKSGRLILKEIATGKEWIYQTREIDFYKFSPDDTKLAIIQENTSKGYAYGKMLMGWDFKSSKITTLFEHINSGSYSNFDWK